MAFWAVRRPDVGRGRAEANPVGFAAHAIGCNWAPTMVNSVSRRFFYAVLVPLLVLAVCIAVVPGDWMVGEQSVERAGIRPRSVVRDFVAHDVNDVNVKVDFNGGLPTLLYVFSPICVWCDSNYENIVALATMLSTQFRFIGLADSAYGAELMAGYLRAYPLPFDVLFLDPVTAGLDFSLTPQTVVVRADGVVQHAWGGRCSAGGSVMRNTYSASGCPDYLQHRRWRHPSANGLVGVITE